MQETNFLNSSSRHSLQFNFVLLFDTLLNILNNNGLIALLVILGIHLARAR